MPMALVLVSGQQADVPSVHAGRRLADLGISGITVLSDEHTVALVLEGWAFDPARTAEAAELLLPPGASPPLVLKTQFHVTVQGFLAGLGP
jgi:hypothetical protein